MIRVDTDCRKDGPGESRGVTDDSYPLSRELVHSPCIGWAMRGAANRATVEQATAVLLEELRAEGLPETDIRVTEWKVGRSAQGAELLIYVVGGVVAAAAGIKQIDEAIPVLRKWWRAISRAHKRLNGRRLTIEALKLACVDDVAEVYGTTAAPDVGSILTTAGAAQYADGTWSPTNPVYVILPDQRNRRTYLRVIRGDGEILYRAVTPYLHDDDWERFRLGPVVSAGAVDEADASARSNQHEEGAST